MGKHVVLPSSIKNDWAITVYEDGDWRRQALRETSVGSYEATTLQRSHVRVKVRRVEETEHAGTPRSERVVYYVAMEVSADQDGKLAGLKLHLPLHETLQCSWKPHLAPQSNMTISDKAFRSPVIVMEDGQQRLALVPDLDLLRKERQLPHIMDYERGPQELYYGVCDSEETGHVYYKLTPQARQLSRKLHVAFYLVSWEKQAGEALRDFREVEAFLWERFASSNMTLQEAPEHMLASLARYPQYAYEWALDRWRDVSWQQFILDGRQVGGVVFIVTAKQKPGLGQEDQWREAKSLWNQAWFCGLRTAYGYWQAGHQYGRQDWIEKAEAALEFALSAPQIDGLFPCYYEAGADGAWETGGWRMSSPRSPEDHEDYVHLLDASWTCYWLLMWYRHLRQDERILTYVRSYVDRLLRLQREDGGFPAWVEPHTSAASPFLTDSPETAIHAMLLCQLHEIEADPRYVESAEQACRYVLEHIVPAGRWEDFETYWSCSRQWEGKRYGVKDESSGLYNQCNFGIYWTAEALLMLYEQTGEQRWLDAGERVLAELSLYQQIWEPEYIDVPTLGGFGVMTSDDEWNDARQSLFALTYYRYYLHTADESYLARGLWAMKASFYMMYCPDNPDVMKLYEEVHPHLNEHDYGFHMENFNHHDGTPTKIGEFTIFDWGCGAASSSFYELQRLMSK